MVRTFDKKDGIQFQRSANLTLELDENHNPTEESVRKFHEALVGIHAFEVVQIIEPLTDKELREMQNKRLQAETERKFLNNPYNRKAVNNRIRFKILEKYGFKCVYCGANPEKGKLMIDHVLPVSKGGTNDEANLVPACFECNNGKKDKILDEGNGINK